MENYRLEKMNKVSCIICAYNEEKGIGNVLRIVQNHRVIEEVIVVDDGSSDRTADIVRGCKKVKLITYKKNQGKSHALALGIIKAKNKLIMLIDADLIGLKAENIAALALPVIKGEADVTMSLRQNNVVHHNLLTVWVNRLVERIGLDFLSGERVLHKALLQAHVKKIRKLPGFGIEVFMNRLMIKKRVRLKIVRWNNVINPRKEEKNGFWAGTEADIRMVRHILKVISLSEVIEQNKQLRELCNRKE